METYTLYKKARNKVWKILTKYKLTKFPLNLTEICKLMKITLISSEQAEFEEKPDSEAFSIQSKKGNVIVFNKNTYPQRLRFSIAHEISHIVLKHKGIENNFTNSEANIFARCLLMPAIVCYQENLDSAYKIEKFFNVSHEAAQIRADRINELFIRNKWLTSHLERKYYKLYLKANNKKPRTFQNFEEIF